VYPYCALSIGDITHRRIVKRDVVEAHVDFDKECYKTVYNFNESFLEYARKNGSLAGYRDQVSADYFPIDIDCSDLGQAKQQLTFLTLTLEKEAGIDMEDYKIYFSGNRGFHLHLPVGYIGSIGKFFPTAFKQIGLMLKSLGLNIDLKIYDINRIFRIENTRHRKSGLYKIEIVRNDLIVGIEHIKEKAQKGRGHLDELITTSGTTMSHSFFQKAFMESEKPRNILTPVSSLWSDHPENSDRDNTLFRLACYLRDKGLQQDLIELVLDDFDRCHNKPPLGPGLVKVKIKSAFTRKPSNLIQSNIEVSSPENHMEGFRNYFDIVRKNRIEFGIPELDNDTEGQFPCEVNYILGAQGSGKSRWGLHIAAHNSKRNIGNIVLYIPEMTKYSAIITILMSEWGVSKQVAIQKILDMEAKGQPLRHPAIDNIYIVDKNALSIPDIEGMVHNINNPKLLIIDYFNSIQIQGRDNTNKAAAKDQALADSAKKLKIPITVIHHVGRDYDEFTRVDISAGRDSGVIEISAFLLVGMWWADREKTMINFELLKNKHSSVANKVYSTLVDRSCFRFEAYRERKESDIKDGIPF